MFASDQLSSLLDNASSINNLSSALFDLEIKSFEQHSVTKLFSNVEFNLEVNYKVQNILYCCKVYMIFMARPCTLKNEVCCFMQCRNSGHVGEFCLRTLGMIE